MIGVGLMQVRDPSIVLGVLFLLNDQILNTCLHKRQGLSDLLEKMVTQLKVIQIRLCRIYRSNCLSKQCLLRTIKMNVYFVCQIFDSHLRNEFLEISAFAEETCFVSQGLVKSDSISDVLLASADHSEVP